MYLISVCLGLAHAHRKRIMHGDLTPASIVFKLDKENPGCYPGVKIRGFG